MNRTPILSIRGRCGKLGMAGCFSTTRALRCKITTKHINNFKVCVSVSAYVLYITIKSSDAKSHFARSFVNKYCANVSIFSGGLDSSVLLYFLFCSCSFCNCWRTCSSTSATVVNLHKEQKQTRLYVVYVCLQLSSLLFFK